MKLAKTMLASCLLVCAGVASAGGVQDSEVVPMAYLSLPFGGQPARDTELSYGFGVSMAQVDQHEGLNFMQSGKSRLVDFSFTDHQFTALKFNGINAMADRMGCGCNLVVVAKKVEKVREYQNANTHH